MSVSLISDRLFLDSMFLYNCVLSFVFPLREYTLLCRMYVGLARRVFHEYMLYHQLGQFQSLCLINGLPLAPLWRERRSAPSAFSARCVHTNNTRAHTPTGARIVWEDQQRTNGSSIASLTYNCELKEKICTLAFFCMYFMVDDWKLSSFCETNYLSIWLQKPQKTQRP